MEEKAIDTIDRQTWLVVKSLPKLKSDLKYPSLHLPYPTPTKTIKLLFII